MKNFFSILKFKSDNFYLGILEIFFTEKLFFNKNTKQNKTKNSRMSYTNRTTRTKQKHLQKILYDDHIDSWIQF